MAKGIHFKSAKIILDDGSEIDVTDTVNFDEELEQAHIRKFLNPYGCRYWSYLFFLKGSATAPDQPRP